MAKANLQSQGTTQDIYQHYSQGLQLVNLIVSKNQNQSINNLQKRKAKI